MRRQLVHILVVAMLRWMGPWQRFHKGTLKGWARAIETAIWGYGTPPGRLRLFVLDRHRWTSLSS